MPLFITFLFALFIPGILALVASIKTKMKTYPTVFSVMLFAQVALTLISGYLQGLPDPPDQDQYYGIFLLLIGTAVLWAAFGLISIYALKKTREANHAVQPTPYST